MTRHTSAPLILPIAARLRADTASTGRGIGIAMIDSDAVMHPDLAHPEGRVRRYVDATTHTDSPLPPTVALARHWHGTMTACTAAGDGSLSKGAYTALAPDAHLVLIRTMHDNGRIPTDTIVWALDWLLGNAERYGVRVVNMSVYADELDQTLDHPVTQRVEALVARGIVVVAAAGNNAHAPIRPPAAAPSALTVGGIDDHNDAATDTADLYHSSFGTTALGIQKPDVVAPAMWLAAPMIPGTPVQEEAAALCAMDAMSDEMLQTCMDSLVPYTLLRDLPTGSSLHDVRAAISARIQSQQVVSPHYKMVDGTSFAAPIVTSIVAQMLAIDSALTPAQVKRILMSTAIPLPTYPMARQGAGVIDQPSALRHVMQRAVASTATV